MKKILLSLLSLFVLSSMSLGETLRDRAINLLDLKPFMGTFADYTMTDLPEDLEDWPDWDKEKRGTIAELETALKGKASKNTKFEFHEKLYELYLAREVFLRAKIEGHYIKQWDRYSRGELNDEPKLSFKKSQALIFKAISHLRSLVSNHRKHPRLDRVYYELARNLCRIGNNNHTFYFTQFKRRFPKSSFNHHARLAQADCLYDSGKYSEAGKLYYQQAKIKKDPWRAYALYRQGWIQLAQLAGKDDSKRMEILSRAERSLQIAVKLSEDDDDDDERQFSVFRSSLPELAWIYALQGQERAALKYFKKVDQLEYLADYYYRHGYELYLSKQYSHSIKLHSVLIKKYPTYKKLPETFKILVDSYEKSGKLKSMVTTFSSIVKLIDEDSDFYDEHEDDEAFIVEVQNQFEAFFRDIGSRYSEVGETENKPDLLLVAEAAYRSYLKSFPERDHAYDINFYLASLYFKRGAFDMAAKEFTNVFKMKETNASHRRNAAFNAVLSLSQLDGKQKYKKLPKFGTIKEEIDLPPVKKALQEAVETFVEAFPQDDDAPSMRFTVAQSLMNYGHYDESIEMFEELAASHPDNQLGHESIKAIFSLFAHRQDWATIRDKALEYMENPKLIQPEMQQILTTSLSEAEDNLRSANAQLEE